MIQSPFSDYPFPDGKHRVALCGTLRADVDTNTEFPRHPTAIDLASYYQEYAKHFGLQGRIIFDVSVTAIKKDDNGPGWLVSISGEDRPRVFDKIVIATGSEITRNTITIEGLQQFEGRFIHGQEYKRYATLWQAADI